MYKINPKLNRLDLNSEDEDVKRNEEQFFGCYWNYLIQNSDN